MHLSTVLLPLISLVSTLQATPLPSEEGAILASRATGGNFAITDFYNSGVPHSVVSYVSFTVKDPSTNLNALCSASQSIFPTVVTAPFPTKCNTPGVSFGLEYLKGTGYILQVIHRYNRDRTIDLGTIWLGTDVQTRVNPANPNGNVQYLNYTTAFTVPFSRYTQLTPLTK
ncbi:hypothetical protein ABW20_dc0110186 [Dactylellina cionopaga]|nr:hypothetical protein ABW20_dc0110186 [Dactylellina cionopaga]